MLLFNMVVKNCIFMEPEYLHSHYKIIRFCNKTASNCTNWLGLKVHEKEITEITSLKLLDSSVTECWELSYGLCSSSQFFKQNTPQLFVWARWRNAADFRNMVLIKTEAVYRDQHSAWDMRLWQRDHGDGCPVRCDTLLSVINYRPFLCVCCLRAQDGILLWTQRQQIPPKSR
jgi:hypothetical protein